MININILRENTEEVKKSEIKRKHGSSLVDNALQKDKEWKTELKLMQELNHKRNVVSEEINQAKKNKEEDIAQQKINEMREVINNIKNQVDKTESLLKERNEILKKIGNILHENVPLGKDESENKELKKVGTIPSFDFIPKDHIELGLDLDIIDLDTASEVAGARFYYLKNEAVLLDLALQRYAIDRLLAKGFQLISPPLMLNKAALEGGVDLSEFQDTIYKIENEDLYLIGTSEHPLIALKKDSVLPHNQLPYKLCGISPCFRKEAGSHGRDTKGIFRVHQFNKIEQVIYAKPEDSYDFFHEMQNNTEEMFKDLKIPFRVVNICSGDIGNKQALQYDIEAWFPGQNEKKGAYREVTSCSNCTDYQAITLNTKYQREDNNEKEYVHTLNNTAIATTRAIVAILENFQTKEGTVKIPKVLWPYMNGITEIKKKK